MPSSGFKKRRAARFDCPPEAPPAPPDPAPAAKGPAKGPGKGAAKGPAKGKGKSPAEAPAAKGPAKGPGKGPGKGPAKGKGKSPAEAPAAKGPAKGPGKGPAKGPAKGKGKSPAEATRTPPPKAPAMRESEDDIQIREPDEVKVQEDQLLTEREEFICKICQIHVVGCRPKLTSCAHLFCGDCITQWFDQQPENKSWAERMKAAGPNREAPCPVCRNILNESDLVTVSSDTQGGQNTLLWNFLSKLRIICVNNHKLRKEDGQCDWVGTYGTYQTHIQDCKNVPLATSVPVENQPEREEVPAADNGFSAGYSDTGVVGVASGDFEPTGPTMIRVRKGDTIEVLETHHTGWSFAKNLSQSSPPGWVPYWIVDSNRNEHRGEHSHGAAQPAAAPAPAASSVQPTQTPTFWAQATTDFDAGGRDREMTLSKDDLIEIVEYDWNASGWSFGRIVDHGVVVEGYFPNWACTPFSP